MKTACIAILSINPNLYIFVSAIAVSQFVNLYTQVFGADVFPRKWLVLLASAALAAFASIFLALLGWRLEAISRVAFIGEGGADEAHRLFQELLREQFGSLSMLLIGSGLSGALSLVILVVDPHLLPIGSD